MGRNAGAVRAQQCRVNGRVRIAAVILAAGASSRLGEAKQLVRLHGETLLDRAIACAHAAGCAPVVVVLGARAAEIAAGCRLTDAQTIVNPNWEEGMASSIRTGIETLPAGTEGTLLLTCDQPAVTSAHLGRLLGGGADPVASRYAGRNGIPAYFPASWFARLLQLEGDRGARDLLRTAKAIVLEAGEIDVDTPAALESARRLFTT